LYDNVWGCGHPKQGPTLVGAQPCLLLCVMRGYANKERGAERCVRKRSAKAVTSGIRARLLGELPFVSSNKREIESFDYS